MGLTRTARLSKCLTVHAAERYCAPLALLCHPDGAGCLIGNAHRQLGNAPVRVDRQLQVVPHQLALGRHDGPHPKTVEGKGADSLSKRLFTSRVELIDNQRLSNALNSFCSARWRLRYM